MRCLLLSLLLVAAAAATSDEKIVGGYECSPHGVPWQVSLDMGYHGCGGSLISDRWVISAAHCWYNPYYLKVLLGAHSLTAHAATEQLIRVESIYWNQKYDYQTLDNDIMLVKLERPVMMTDSIRPVQLPTECPLPYTQCVVSGWGNIYSDSVFMPDALRCVKVPLMNDAACKSAYPGLITSNMICAGYMEGGKDACNGDSGGPLVCDGILQGIVSWGRGCALKDSPGVYTKVCAFLPWINEIMATK
ncbi:anionic trypsin-1-like [Scyliorhinus canicula]|uniref:anionic trypsin-1-like n=1 Tax=Scyliorhinus canicula TaxID=7830 RepID=UPI0018F31127|nr:anionic trypsin-1-like [Scyliorhinus canicula]